MAQTINRRAALGSLAAAAGEMLAVPAIANAAEHPDADLIAFARNVKAQGIECYRAEDALEDMFEKFDLPPVPDCLLIRSDDAGFVGIDDRDLANHIGKPIPEKHMKVATSMRAALQRLLATSDPDSPANASAIEALARVTEIDLAARQHLAAIESAKEAAGILAAEAKVEALNDELKGAWSVLASMPARTIDGVVAKLDAVSHLFVRFEPGYYPPKCRAGHVLEAAAGDMATVRARV